MSAIFRDFLEEVRPIRFKEPLAETLGAVKGEGAILEYTFVDAVKMAGHACPTVAGAYLSCQKALERLYPDEIPVRGEISITVYGESDEGVYGVMAQVFGFLTGAAPATGFRGLGHKFKRKDLLRFIPGKIDPQAMCFEFRRLDNGKAVLVKFYPQQIPFSAEKAKRLAKLLEKVIWEAAKEEEALFPEIERFIPREGGPTGMMLIEHEDLGNTNKEFQRAVDEYLGDSDSAEIKRIIQEFGTRFIGVLRDHIDKENNILFTMADMHLDQTQIDKVIKLFYEIENAEEKGGNPGGNDNARL